MAPKRARPSRNNEAGSSREHERLSAEEKGKAPAEDLQDEPMREMTVTRVTQEVDPRIIKFKFKFKLNIAYTHDLANCRKFSNWKQAEKKSWHCQAETRHMYSLYFKRMYSKDCLPNW